jgi:hypothetical protein
MHQPISRLGIAIIATLTTTSSFAAEAVIARWVDADGVTHFSNPQFAPPQAHSTVTVEPTNSMAVPAQVTHDPAGDGPAVFTLDRSKFENKRGFRGYHSRPSAGQNRRPRRR